MVGVTGGSVAGNMWLRAGKAEAVSRVITARADFELGKYRNTESETKEGQLKLRSSGSWGPRVWTVPNVNLGDHAAVTSDGDYVYLIPNGDTWFGRYLPNEDRWEDLTVSPVAAYSGSDMITLGNYIYTIFGGYQKEFYRYSKVTNSWQLLSNLPDLVYGGSSLTTDGTNIFCLRGTSTTDFWRYNPGSDSWSVLSGIPASAYVGADLVYSASTNKLYTPRGNNTNTFYIYDIGTSAWSTGATLPATVNDSTNIAINGDYLYALRNNASTAFYRYQISLGVWSTLAVTPQTARYVGAVYNAADNYVYVFRGGGTPDFWKYNTASNSFDGPTDLPAAPGTGSDLNFYNGYLYYNRGGANTMYRYNLGTGATWETMATLPATITDDTKGVWAGSKLYLFQGNGSRNFFNYDPTLGVGGSWGVMATAPATIYYGGAIAYPGSGGYLYATRGALSRTFMRYDIAGNSWSDIGATDLPDDAEAGYGARIIGVGTTELFYIGGHGIAKFLKYNITSDSWSVLGNLPFSPYYGTDMVYYNGKIYFQAGYYKRDIWEYNIVLNSWRRLPDVPGYNAYDLGPYNGGSLESDGAGTLYSSAGMNVAWLRKFTIGANNYQTNGDWTSGVMDLTYAGQWSGISLGKTTPNDSAVAVYTRSSSDQTTWSNWGAVVGTSIPSAPLRYLQVGLTLTASTGGSDTPVVNDLTVSYVGDTGLPSNPSTIMALSQQVSGVGLTSGQSYGYNQPYFAWSGATDSETSVAGYYVYFGSGTTASIDPVNDGNYQTEASYLATTPMISGNYYLLIKTKDAAGNVSSNTWQAFEYIYNGVSPYISLVQTSSVEFSTGTTANMDISGDQLKLKSRSGFWQQERLSVTPNTIYNGAGMAYVEASNKLYIMRGNSSNFYIYDLNNDSMSSGVSTPATVGAGGDLVEGPSGYLYAFRGAGTDDFWQYDIGASTWSDAAAADAPALVNYGGALIYDGSRYIYAIRGEGDDTFWRYDTSADSWEALDNADFGAVEKQVNNAIGYGGDLAYDTLNNKVYVMQGNTRSGMAIYDVMSGSWNQTANIPALAYYGGRIEYDSTSNAIYCFTGWDKPFFFKYEISGDTWSKLTDVPAAIGYGGSMKKIGSYLYVARGANTTTLYKYKISKNSWVTPTWNLFGGWFRGSDYRTFSNGAEIVKGDSNNFYIARGNYDNLFMKYNATTGETTKLTDIPAGIYTGSEMTYDNVNNKIYASTSMYDKKFLVYDVAGDEWSTVAGGGGTLPTDAGEGSALVFDGSEYIYRLRGGNTQTFHRFSVNTGLWSTLPNTPAAMQYGADLVKGGDYLFATRGVGTTAFFRYGPLSGVGIWSSYPTISYLPAGMTFNYDGFLVNGGSDYIYGCRGGNTADCFRYSISGNSWQNVGVSMPANVTYGGAAAVNSTGDRMYVIAGAGANTFSNGLYSYVLQTDNSSYEDSGSFISQSHDLTSVYRWANLQIGYSSANSNTIIVSTRTSANNSNWDSWVEASAEKQIGNTYFYKIGSAAKRYIQVKLEMTSGDGIYSGAVTDYAVNYYQDVVEPSNPLGLIIYENSGMGATIVSGVYHGSSGPYFDWPGVGESQGASDGEGGSGIAGYYVYYGIGATADPVVLGTFTTATHKEGVGMTTGHTYYFRMKTKDEAGNVSGEVGSTFVFNYDANAPSNPVSITADPPGYTASNSYTFTWSGASDAGAGIEGYFYKTGAVGATETFTTETTVTGIRAYQTGTNTFYVRTKDLAGNVSDYATATYYYSSTAPSVPANIRLTYPEVGTSNTVNEFAFAWDKPTTYYGQESGLRYYYSINELPSATNVNSIGLSVTYLSKGSYATRKGTNTLYVVAMDEAGNIDYRLYGSLDFEAATSAPGIPKDLEIADVSVKETRSWKLAVSWDAPAASGSGISLYKVYRSATESANCSTDITKFGYVSSTTGLSFVDTGLTQQRYYYCVKACDSTNECSAPSDTVVLLPDGKWRVAPSLVASPSAVVKTKSATISWSTNRASNSFVKYGKTSGSYGEEVGSSDQISAHSIALSGLDPGTTYYYKALWTDEDGNTGESSELSFTTNAAPAVSAVKVTDLGLYSAYITFTLKNATTARVEYGKTSLYGSFVTVTTSTNESSYTVKLDGLAEGTSYHMRIVAEDEEANTFMSDDYIFDTLPLPKLSGIKIQQVRGMPTATIRVAWLSNTGISSIVTYYPIGRPEMARDQIVLTLTKTHEMIVKDLSDNTDYVVIIKGKDVAGNSCLPSEQAFKTSEDMRPPAIIDLKVETSVSGVGQEARAQIVVYWDTDEPASAQIEYGQGTGSDYPNKTQEDTTLILNHTVTITDLQPNQVYHLRVITKDKAENSTVSYDNVIITPKSTRSAMDLVVDSLSKSFGFFNSLGDMVK
jgi:hypothetical protein